MALITETSLRAMLRAGIPDPFLIREGDKLTPAAADFLKDRGIALRRIDQDADKEDPRFPLIPVGVSNRHVHLSPQHVEALFGAGVRLTSMRELSQKGQFAARETVALIGLKGSLANVRVLGPARGKTQVEISRTDGFALGIHPPVRLSGDIEGTPGIELIGPSGAIQLQEGLILARNHVHLSPEEAHKLHVSSGDRLMLQAEGDRPMIFADAVARIAPNFSLDFHIDLDEANAARLDTGSFVRLIGINGKLTGA
ncbi:phosphate propanoyltransferase [Cohnella yongneupensis]|uniref:Phosphate propanoyltransferase n=1 Tax=Cohnella yongneupensis TaxID=425006 RepID=A0ABW0QW98_9BACL